MSPVDVAELHASSLIVDGTCPGDWWYETYPDWVAGGAGACVVTVAGWESCREAVGLIATAHQFLRERPDLTLATTVREVREARAAGRLAAIFQFQGTHPFEYDPELAEVYHRLGVRVVQLTYNVRSPAGDGCEEPGDAGLSRFGHQLVAEFNRLGIVVDVSHTGWRTSLDAVAASARPAIASHSNAHAVQAHRRNMPDELIRAIAETGGVIGANGYPPFVDGTNSPTLDGLIDHMAYIGELVGIQHVGIGLDYTTPNPPLADYEHLVAEGVWTREGYPPPPWNYPEGLRTAAELPNLTSRLLERGFVPDEVRGILGENWLRVFESVWGA